MSEINEETRLLQNRNPVIQNGDGQKYYKISSSYEFKTYRRRWYILVLYGIFGFNQGWGWNIIGPIAASTKYAFNWSNTIMGLMESWAPLMFLTFVMPFSWLMQYKGMRVACLLASACMVFGGAFRVLALLKIDQGTWLLNLGTIGYCIAGPVAVAGSSVLSAIWFPPEERFTATTLTQVIKGMGQTMNFLLGPRFVHDITNVNTTTLNYTEESTLIFDDMRIYMYGELGVTALIFLALLIYFPKQPPTPPSLSTAANEDMTFSKGLKKISKNGQFWLLSSSVALATGVYCGWTACFDVNMEDIGVSQVEAGWLTLAGNLSSMIVAVFTARLVDKLSGKTKPVLLVLFIGAAVGSLIFALVCGKYIPMSSISLYVSRILGACSMVVLQPLVFEVLCEATYPVPASVNNGVITFMLNFCMLLFTSILMVPGIGTIWMNWFMFASCLLCIPMVIIFKEKHNRLDMDTTNTSSTGNIQTTE